MQETVEVLVGDSVWTLPEASRLCDSLAWLVNPLMLLELLGSDPAGFSIMILWSIPVRSRSQRHIPHPSHRQKRIGCWGFSTSLALP
jgi:hypothetical protein